jgi:Ser/Thr protein kinase RdoA (MazF antagonist)
MSDEQPDIGDEFEMIMPFWIDTEAYTDRDRDMFVSGYEFAELHREALMNAEPFSRTIRSENVSRIRMMLSRLNREFMIAPSDVPMMLDTDAGRWHFLDVK